MLLSLKLLTRNVLLLNSINLSYIVLFPSGYQFIEIIVKRVGLLHNIKVIDDQWDTTKNSAKFFLESFMFVITVQCEFCPMNCPLSTPSQVNYPCEMSSDEFKNHLRNIKYFLQKGNLDSRSNLCIIQQSNFRLSTRKWYVYRLAQGVRNSF